MVVYQDATTAFRTLCRVVDVVVDVESDSTTTTHTLLLLLVSEKYSVLTKAIIKLGYFTYQTLEDETGIPKTTIQKFLDRTTSLGIVEEASKLRNTDGPPTIIYRTPTATDEQMDEAVRRDRALKRSPVPFTRVKRPPPPAQEASKEVSQFTLNRIKKLRKELGIVE